MRSRTSAQLPSPNTCAIAFETGDQPAGHSFSPVAIRAACHRSSVSTISAIRPRIRSASPRWLPLNRSGRCTLRIQNADVDADEDEHDEEVDEEREPALGTEPRQRLALGDRADQRHHDRREEDEEAPEDERMDEPGAEPLEQLLLPEHDDGLVADPPRHVVEALHGLARAGRAGSASARGGRRAGPRRRARGRSASAETAVTRVTVRLRPRLLGVPLTRAVRSSAEIAGSTSCRSPTTA